MVIAVSARCQEVTQYTHSLSNGAMLSGTEVSGNIKAWVRCNVQCNEAILCFSTVSCVHAIFESVPTKIYLLRAKKLNSPFLEPTGD